MARQGASAQRSRSSLTVTGKYVTQFETPFVPKGVAIGSGVAFVADNSGGLVAVNYLPFDTQGVAPTITVDASSIDADPSTPGTQAVEGSLVTLKASVSDDVQVRNVELLVNGQVVKNNVTFPFDLSAFLPTIAASGGTATLEVRATDTGGNTTTSEPITINLLRDMTPPTIVSQNPRDGGTVGQQFRAVVVDFSEPLDPATVSAADFALTSAGGTIAPEKVQLRLNNTQVQITFPAGVLSLGDYQLVIHAANITDRSGNALGTGDATSTVHVSQYSEVWTNINGGDWNDSNNWDSLRVPQPGDNVLIDVPGNVTITYAAGDTSIRSLLSHDALTISGGSFSATQSIEVDSQLTISGGVLQDTLVLPSAGGQPVVATRGTLDGVTFNGDVSVPGGSYVVVVNGDEFAVAEGEAT